jgi:heme A synthase
MDKSPFRWFAQWLLPLVALTVILTATVFYTWATLIRWTAPMPSHGFSDAQRAEIANQSNGHH